MAGILSPGRGAADDAVGAHATPAAHPWQQRIALVALVLPVPPVVQMLTVGLSPSVLIAPALLLAAPTALRAHRARFMTACVVLAVALLGWSLFGFMEGTWVFLPSSLLLLCANFADPRAYATPAAVFGFAAVAIGVLPAIGSLTALVHLLGG
ncbi:hypothetical protein M8Z33_37595 [Streptomyces sp. ZAF1911]|uniref:hypothetical protein n=1 Tax=Streptomyces sp. ZAF1911 TaxID=2944129 RepID=UPI00237A6603|nr:hypothetical protein [Streptomyces sp. ZAF1911]MDD9382264.1 hypothetical protein [Streptomyces sp. ZAF1911]